MVSLRTDYLSLVVSIHLSMAVYIHISMIICMQLFMVVIVQFPLIAHTHIPRIIRMHPPIFVYMLYLVHGSMCLSTCSITICMHLFMGALIYEDISPEITCVASLIQHNMPNVYFVSNNLLCLAHITQHNQCFLATDHALYMAVTSNDLH